MVVVNCSEFSTRLCVRYFRFVFVETAFLWRWWEEQDEWNRNTFKMLVNEGRLQLLHGGWVMSDEAVPHYSTLIDQMTLGLK